MAGQRFAFVLRLWMEMNADEATDIPRMRGSLQAVDSEHVYYFSSLESILELLQDITGWRDGLDQAHGVSDC